MKTFRALCALESALFLAFALAACSGENRKGLAQGDVKANEAPSAEPFGTHMQNRIDDNNILKYRESMTVHDEGRLTGQSRPQIAQHLAEALGTMAGVQSANVLVSGDQAFVAVAIQDANGRTVRQPGDRREGVSTYMKGAITDKIRTMQPAIHHVYISDRPDLVQRFETIHKDTRDGRAPEQLLRELSEAVARLFPTWTVGNNPPPLVP